MARKLGSKHKVCRRFGERVCTTDKCPLGRRSYPPGVHGPTQRRVKLTSFGIQLREKQKAKAVYGLLENQFKNYVLAALKKKGNTTHFLLQRLEGRLDNVIFRLGFAKTRAQARQFVNHGHFLVNGKRVDIPSFQVRTNDVISIKVITAGVFKNLAEKLEKYDAPSWLSLDREKFSGRVLELPKEEDLQSIFDSKLIVEFYSR